jgi:hypothetical protein
MEPSRGTATRAEIPREHGQQAGGGDHPGTLRTPRPPEADSGSAAAEFWIKTPNPSKGRYGGGFGRHVLRNSAAKCGTLLIFSILQVTIGA